MVTFMSCNELYELVAQTYLTHNELEGKKSSFTTNLTAV